MEGICLLICERYVRNHIVTSKTSCRSLSVYLNPNLFTKVGNTEYVSYNYYIKIIYLQCINTQRTRLKKIRTSILNGFYDSIRAVQLYSYEVIKCWSMLLCVYKLMRPITKRNKCFLKVIYDGHCEQGGNSMYKRTSHFFHRPNTELYICNWIRLVRKRFVARSKVGNHYYVYPFIKQK